MHIHQRTLANGAWTASDADASPPAQLVLAFAPGELLASAGTWHRLRAWYPNARIVACSTAGEIAGTSVYDDTLVCTGLRFDHSAFVIATVHLHEATDSHALGALLASRLPAPGLRHVLVFSDGLHVNGSALVQGMNSLLAEHVAITGGLSADGSRFERTAVCVDGPQPVAQIAAVGLYGERLEVGYGCFGGWDPFGVERRITKSDGNVLYELDGEPVLDLYRRYLADQAADLPASGLRFPLAIRDAANDAAPLVRTILSVDEDARTLTFAGDVPLGHRARLMKSNVEHLIDGAHEAGRAARLPRDAASKLALLVSCVGRKQVLKQRVEEEVEAACDALGPNTVVTGFYSYGELSPSAGAGRCDLHNQTMAVTTLAES